MKLVPPAPASIAADPASCVNCHRVRIDLRKAESVGKVITVAFLDRTVALYVRVGIAECLPESANYLRLNSLEPKQQISLSRSYR